MMTINPAQIHSHVGIWRTGNSRIAQHVTKQMSATLSSTAPVLYEEAKEKDGDASRYDIREEYAKQHEDYRKLRNQCWAVESEISKLENERRQRASFHTRLGKCVDKVKEAELKAAA